MLRGPGQWMTTAFDSLSVVVSPSPSSLSSIFPLWAPAPGYTQTAFFLSSPTSSPSLRCNVCVCLLLCIHSSSYRLTATLTTIPIFSHQLLPETFYFLSIFLFFYLYFPPLHRVPPSTQDPLSITAPFVYLIHSIIVDHTSSFCYSGLPSTIYIYIPISSESLYSATSSFFCGCCCYSSKPPSHTQLPWNISSNFFFSAAVSIKSLDSSHSIGVGYLLMILF